MHNSLSYANDNFEFGTENYNEPIVDIKLAFSPYPCLIEGDERTTDLR